MLFNIQLHPIQKSILMVVKIPCKTCDKKGLSENWFKRILEDEQFSCEHLYHTCIVQTSKHLDLYIQGI